MPQGIIEVKERPILFSGPMVRAILENRKTQTRRVVKDTGFYAIHPVHGEEVVKRELKALATQCPYGTVSDRLWVRETWMPFDADHTPPNYAYRADTTPDGEEYRKEYIKCGRDYRWRSPRYMPRCASRITLEITDVRVERLNEISRGDAMSEGCPFPNIATFESPVVWFKSLWHTIHAADGPNSWTANPWVWAISFKKL